MALWSDRLARLKSPREIMNQEIVLQRLQDIFDEVFLEPVEVSADLSADDVEEWDSLLQIVVVAAVEANFGIRFRIGEVEATTNVGQFANLILQRLNEQGATNT